MARGNEIGALLPGPSKQTAKLEIAIASHTRIGRATVQIILGKRLHHSLDKLRSKVEECVRNTEQRGNLFCASVIGTNPRPGFSFPHAQRYTLNVVPLLDEQPRGYGTIDAAAHGNDDLLLSR